MTDKNYFDIVFVVLVYKNIAVLEDFFASLRLPFPCKVIVVNSFYDTDSEKLCHRVAETNQADYIAIPNKGFSTGNNIGCEHAIQNYKFKYLIVSNSDVVINDFSYLQELKQDIAVYAPDTRMLTGHRQNPNIPCNSALYHSLLKCAYKHESDFVLRMAHVVNRVNREFYVAYSKLFHKDKMKIFAPHGSCIIFSYQASILLMPIFNNEMFLYNEELFLAFHCKQEGVPIYYVPKLKLTHLEGASSTSSSNSWMNHKQSFNVLQQWLNAQNPVILE